jgi:hypothetical protein
MCQQNKKIVNSCCIIFLNDLTSCNKHWYEVSKLIEIRNDNMFKYLQEKIQYWKKNQCTIIISNN